MIVASRDDAVRERRRVAEQLPNRTWRVFVKWQGFADDHITPEPLSQILKTVSDPDLLKQIRTAQDDYLAANPAQRNFVRPEPPAEAPTRVQPARASRQKATVLLVRVEDHDVVDSNHVCRGLRCISDSVCNRYAASLSYYDDFPDCALDFADRFRPC